MSLTPVRYIEIDADLQNLHYYLASLADELACSPDDDVLACSSSAVTFAANHMLYIQHMLRFARKKSEERSQRTHSE